MIKELFKIDEKTFLVELNKEWISTIPEFAEIIRKDKGCKGDADGRKKYLSKKIFTFIYHYCDFLSQFSDFGQEERRKEALYNAGLEESDITTTVEIAIEKYKKLQETRVLKLLEASNNAIDKLSDYFNDIDFESRDVNDKLIHSPKDVMSNIQNLDKVYGGLKALEERVKKELKESARVRGDVQLNEFEDPDAMNRFLE
jgi:hypothetical protein